MKTILTPAVGVLLPVACAWAKRQESFILKTGAPLSIALMESARRLGIRHPERVRLRSVPRVPPVNRFLEAFGERLGIISPHTIGMTLRYGIFVREDHWGNRRLLIHELAHVAQYERMDGFRSFLGQYLQECINPGYPLGELEQEAKRAEWNFS